MTVATARRVVRCDPQYPSVTSLSWATSARSFPFDRSTHSSSFGKNPSISCTRAAGRSDRAPASPPLPSASGGRLLSGPVPVAVPMPEFGRAVFLAAELTAELQAPSVEFTYKRENRW